MHPASQLAVKSIDQQAEQMGEEWNCAFRAFDDEDGEWRPSGKLPPNHGLIDLLLWGCL